MDSSLNHLVNSTSQAVDNANQATAINEWILFTFVVIVPFAFVIALLIFTFSRLGRLKCPKCGNMSRNKVGAIEVVQTVVGNKTIVTKQRAIICSKCKHEFAIDPA